MNTRSIPCKLPTSPLLSLALSAVFAASALGATVSYVGVEFGVATNGYAVQNWSNLGVSKLYDLGGSEVYGTSGYYQIRPMAWDPGAANIYQGASSGNNLGITATNDPTLYSAPVFLSSMTGGAGDYVNFSGYPLVRGPDGSALYRQGALSVAVNNGPYNTPSGNNTGYFGEAFSFTMASNMGADFRLGIAVDAVGSGTYAPDYVSIYNAGIGSTFSTLLTRDGTLDMVFFDLTASAGESFSAALWQLTGTQSAAAFGLVTFDVSRYKLDVTSGLQTNSAVLGGAPAALVKTGAGTSVLTGVSTYQGTTTISNGAVEVGGSGRLASGTYTGAVSLATNTASLRIATTADQTLSGAISGSGSLSKSANGTLTLSGSNSYSGATTISGGRLIATSSNALGDASAALTVSGGAYLDVRTNITRTGTVTFDGGFLATADGAPASLINNGGSFVLTNAAEIVAQLAGSAGLTSGGTGTATLWRSNSYTGATVVNSGTLKLDGSGSLSTNTTLQVASGATFSSTGTFLASNNLTVAGLTGAGTVTGGAGALTIDKASGSDTFSGQLTGGIRLTKAGAGTLVFSGSNSYSGGTLISAGALTLNGGLISGGITNNASLIIDADLLNVVSGTGSLTKTGAGEAYLWSANTYTGATVINAGQITLGGAGAISADSAVQIASGAAVNLTGAFAPGNINRTIGGLTGAGILYGGGGTVTVNKASGSDTFSGDIQGGQGLIKSGSGTLVLSGANSYTGGTTISAGTLQLGDGGATGSIAGAITNNGTLVYNRSNNVTNADTISGSGSLIKNASNTLVLAGANTYSSTSTINAGTLTLVNGNGLGSTTGGTTVASNARVLLTATNGSGFTVGDEALTISGPGVNSGGALRSGTGSNTWQGKVTLAADATIGAASAQALTLDVASGNAIEANNFTLTSENAGTVTIADAISLGTGGLTKIGSGNTILMASNSYIGTTLVGLGTLSLSGNGTLGTGGVTITNGTLNFGGLTRTNASFAMSGGSFTNGTLVAATYNLNGGTIAGNLGAGTVNATSGTTAVNGTLGAGTVNVAGGTLTLGSSGRLATNAAVTVNSGQINLGGNETIGSLAGSGGTVALGANTLTAGGANASTTFGGLLTGSGALVKAGTGTMILTAANTLSGGTILSEGFLRLDNASAAGSGSITQTTNNSTLQINTTGTVANAMSIFNIRTMQTVTLSGTKTLNNATYTVDAGTTTTESGDLNGTGGITKQGIGTLIVTGNNSYTGAVAVDAGVLNLNSSVGGAAATTSSVSVASGATLLLSKSDQVSSAAPVTLSGGTIQRASGVSEVFGSLNLTASSFLDFSGGTAGTIEFSGITYTPSALLALNIANFTQGNTLIFQTTNSLSMTGFSFSGSGGFGSSAFNGSTFTITAIPEPSTCLAAGALLLGMAFSAARRRNRKGTSA